MATRFEAYPERPDANRVVRLASNGKYKEVWIDDPGGTGREIACEVLACPDCAARVRARLAVPEANDRRPDREPVVA